ncbi:MAG: protein kinase [Pseudomonadales bacterium]
MLPPDFELQEFRIVRELGTGGFGITYLAWDNVLDGAVAIKEYFPSLYAHRPDGVAVEPKPGEAEAVYQWGYDKFFEEAQLLSRLRHNNIVGVRRVFKANNTLYLVMEFLEGEPLSSLIAKEGNIAEAEWLSWLLPLCDGLKQLHRLNILHRDIKPENIMICADGDGKALPVFIDFGAARPSTIGSEKSLTTIGTTGYAPLEQLAEENLPQGPFTDIYALACTSFEALTGIKTDDAISSRNLNDRVPQKLEEQRGKISDATIDGLSWGLKLHAKDRPQTLDEWLPVFKGTQTAPPDPGIGAGPGGSNPSGSQPGSDNSHRGGAKPPPIPVGGPPKKRSGMLGTILGISVLGAVVAGVVYFKPDLLESKPDESEQRVNACRSISLETQTQASIRCYQAVLADYPNDSEASQGKIDGLEHLFTQVSAHQAAQRDQQALATLGELEKLGADPERIASARSELFADITSRADRSIKRRNTDEAQQHVDQLEALGGPDAQVKRLREEIAAIQASERRTRVAFAECRSQRQQRRFENAHACFDKLVPEYPEALDEKLAVEADLSAQIDDLLANKELDSAEVSIAAADRLGLDIQDWSQTLQRKKTERQAARKAAAERARVAEEKRKREEAIRAFQARPTYGMTLGGKFLEARGQTVFSVERVNEALNRVLPLASGDQIERLDNQRLGDLEATRKKIAQSSSAAEDFSAGVPDSRVIEELILRKLDTDRGQIKIRIRRNGAPESIFCKNQGKGIQCSGN